MLYGSMIIRAGNIHEIPRICTAARGSNSLSGYKLIQLADIKTLFEVTIPVWQNAASNRQAG